MAREESYKNWIAQIQKPDNGLDRVMNCASLINHMHRCIFEEFHDREIRQATYNIMVILREFGEATSLKDIAAKNPVSIGDLSRLCDRLVAGGYIERVSSRRQGVRTVVRLTDKGNEHLARFNEYRVDLLQRIFGKSNEELNQVAEMLEKLLLDADLSICPT